MRSCTFESEALANGELGGSKGLAAGSYKLSPERTELS